MIDGWYQNVAIFGVDYILLRHIESNIFVLREWTMDWLHGATIKTEAKTSVEAKETKFDRFYTTMRPTFVFMLIMQIYIKIKQQNTKPYPLYLENISKDVSVKNIKKLDLGDTCTIFQLVKRLLISVIS